MDSWRTRRTRKRLKKMGILTDDLEQWANSAMDEAEALRNELRKQESPAYVRLIDEINALTFEPVPARQRYEASIDLVRQTNLSDWERDDLLTQIDRMYGEVLGAHPYDQVISGLLTIESGEFPRERKRELSMKLVKSYNLSEPDVVQHFTREIESRYGAG